MTKREYREQISKLRAERDRIETQLRIAGKTPIEFRQDARFAIAEDKIGALHREFKKGYDADEGMYNSLSRNSLPHGGKDRHPQNENASPIGGCVTLVSAIVLIIVLTVQLTSGSDLTQATVFTRIYLGAALVVAFMCMFGGMKWYMALVSILIPGFPILFFIHACVGVYVRLNSGGRIFEKWGE